MNNIILFSRIDAGNNSYRFESNGKQLKATIAKDDTIIAVDASVVFVDTCQGKKKIGHTVVALDSLPIQIDFDSENNRVTVTRNCSRDISIGKAVCFKTIHSYPDRAEAYFGLANMLKNRTDTITLLDGTKITKERLYLEAIHRNPDFSTAYNNLSILLDTYEEIQLLDGRMMTKRELLERAIQSNPKSAQALNNLANLLSAEEKYTLPDGREMTNKELYTERDSKVGIWQC